MPQYFEDSDIPIPTFDDANQTPVEGYVQTGQRTVQIVETPEQTASKNAAIAYQYAMQQQQQRDQAQAEMAKLPVMQQLAIQKMLESKHEAEIKHQETQIRLGMAERGLQSQIEYRDQAAKRAVEKFIKDQGKSKWYGGAASANMTPAEYAKSTGTVPPDMTSEDARLIHPTGGSMTPNQTYIDRSRHAEALLDARAVDKALNDITMVNRPDTDPRRAELLKRRESARAAVSAIESRMTGEGATAAAPKAAPAPAAMPTPQQAKVALANQLRAQHPDWPKAKIIDAVNAQTR